MFNPDTDKFDALTNVHAAVGVLSTERALVWGNDGLFYFDVKTPSNIQLITEIK